ncbi:uncharacterized protein N7479_006304 [Penicillium vulpinum]|uniref:uncharacterized protein n=1 Tax=Penicillium vulpinum TaxID=29845 RepID=UPI002547957C|nr:uncharacterized protein N7479_006304 [Penicillium vulpinum]KAJ5959154.1 hypothetical protein N7479_006304 [Penicillium vulpinum]
MGLNNSTLPRRRSSISFKRKWTIIAILGAYRDNRSLSALGPLHPALYIAQIMILSWSGTRLQYIINDENSSFFHRERDKALTVLRSHRVVYGDSEWCNILWDDLDSCLFIIDLEDVKRLKRPWALKPTSSNTRYSYSNGA